MITTIEHFASMAMFGYVVSCLIFVAVSWFHMCHPFDNQPKYNYPDRPLKALIYSGALMLIPYILQPSDADSWTFVKAYFFMLIPYYCGVLLYKYFGSVTEWDRWLPTALILGIPLFSVTAILLAFAIFPGITIPARFLRLVMLTVGFLGLIATVFCAQSVRTVTRWTHEASENYSNYDDFPIQYARKVIGLPLLHMLVVWPPILLDSPALMAVVCLLLIVLNTSLLVVKLRPQRMWIFREPEPVTEEEGESLLPQQTVESIIEIIRQNINEKQLYLDPHLTMQEVVDKADYGRTYVSWVFKNKLGGFFYYVNNLRLAYAEQYRKDHPMATLDEVATASGFTSRQSFYRVKQRLASE